MAAPVLTSRQVQNAHTAMDMWVPEYQEIRGKMMTGHVEYQIVVVTALPAFKSARHTAEDVVQFVVSRKYSEIEEFYHKICTLYPKCSLPPFPRKVLFVGETDIRERRAAFNDIVKAIAHEPELAASPELRDFLGSTIGDFIEAKSTRSYVNRSEDGDFFKDEVPAEDPLLQMASKLKNKKAEVQEEEEEEEVEEVDLDPLGIMKEKRIKKKSTTKKREDHKLPSKSTVDLFDDEVDPDEELFKTNANNSAKSKKSYKMSDDIKLFEEQDLGGIVKLGDSLLMPSACRDNPSFKPSTTEDTDALFRVEEDFEKLLSLGMKTKNKPKPQIPAKPTFLKESKNSANLSHMDIKPSEPNVQAMDESDILQYIKENESADSDSLRLF
ncbi:HCLS1-binding protein 3 isoform X2 [Hyla sarda]|uniref:HCLS1-binding protein 3 isoform X2 n=1 Tax=Hyla sarda TaxID=327740 RepID=UPI0024C3E303|nr:HCLS1-binding protein 3 isoform X2 [Hyla sarda]